MKKIRRLIILCLFSFCMIFTSGKSVFAEETTIYLGGMPAGFYLETRGAYVVGLCDVITENGLISPSKEQGIEVGDKILFINNVEINNADDIEKAIRDGDEKNVIIERKGKRESFTVKPALDVNKKPRLGVFIREGINGIGTITYIKNDEFAALGHPVLDDDGNILNVIDGKIYDCNITSYVKGERGKPGELRGVFVRGFEKGIISKNTENGVYGKLNKIDKSKLTTITTGEAKAGNAYILTTIEGFEPKKYSISIVKCDEDERIKNYVIKVTDENLLKTTGGIVQGMSGSPIIQNNKLVGAVTHVFVNDPSRGFGISVNNMLKN